MADLLTASDRSMALLMQLGGLRASEVRPAGTDQVDFGLRRVRVTSKGGKERVVPVDASLFTEPASYLAPSVRPAALPVNALRC
ncbi:tyrosine-type recombinase/integrase [Pseudarthrobacter sp. H2]|uniref:tyrosine-type recombinase/integrase n=1 Tax=Pseudarthrobacter sp. H2 TaxID=3418415 RepID=UPI003CE83A20